MGNTAQMEDTSFPTEQISFECPLHLWVFSRENKLNIFFALVLESCSVCVRGQATI